MLAGITVPLNNDGLLQYTLNWPGGARFTGNGYAEALLDLPSGRALVHKERVIMRGSTLATWLRSPRLDGASQEPQGDVAALHESLAILAPVGDPVFGFVLRVDS